MEEQNRQTEQIERYLNGALSEPERKDFEAAVAGDETLRREVALHRELMETLGDPGLAKLSGVLTEVVRPRAKNKAFSRPRMRRISRRWMGLAATLLLAAFAVFLLMRKPAPAPDSLLAQYFEPYPLDAFRSENAAPVAVPEAIEAYQAGRYAEAIRLFSAMPPDALNPNMQFYRAEALLAGGQGAESARILEALSASGALPGLQQPIEWHLALAWIQAGETPKAKSLLEKIARNTGHYKQKPAADLLKQLPNH
ncbi:MAG: hypothetical protein H6562_05010 [Lewinellaceae bacterium]|nr:hypothetical protein [Lewinellaceae bacterium]